MPALPKVLIVGGPDVHFRLDLMNCLKHEFDVSAVGSEPALLEKFTDQGFEYDSYVMSRRANPLQDIRGIGQLVSIMRRRQPDIVHTFATKPSMWGRFAARLAGVPVIVGTLPGLGSLYATNTLVSRGLRAVYQPLQKLACRVSDLTIFQNQDDIRQFTAAGIVSPETSMVIAGSGVKTDFYDPARVSHEARNAVREELGIQPDEIVATMITRVTRSKGVLDFVTAAQQVQAEIPQARFLLVGPDDGAVDRLNAAELSELRQSVIWPGARSDVPTILAMSDIFVFPSAYREGIPRVLLEAASMGLPIVTTNSPGCNEVVEDGLNGFLIPIKDPTALSQAVLRLLAEPQLLTTFGAVSRERTVNLFDLSVIAEQTRGVYQALLTHKGLLSPN